MAGAEAMLEQLCRAQANVGSLVIRVVLLNDGLLAEKLRESGIHVTIVEETGRNLLSILWQLIKVMREFQPNVVHTHRTKENILGSLAARMTGRILSLRTVHGASEHSHRWWKIHHKIVTGLDAWTATYLQRCVVAVAKDLQSKLARKFKNANICLIPNGIDNIALRSSNRARPVDLPNANFCLLFLGRLAPVKQVERLIQAMQLLEKRQPNMFALAIVGDGPCRRALTREVARHNIESVKFLGFQENPYCYLQNCDGLVLASMHEGLPMCILESLSLGIPVIAPAVGGIPDVVGPNDGILVSDSQPDKLADAILQLADERDRFRPALPPEFEIKNTEKRYRTIYRKLLGHTE